ncbi:MAG TPA: hypothetical protein VIM03_12790, partial [Thermoleophilaceae bacterium]
VVRAGCGHGVPHLAQSAVLVLGRHRDLEHAELVQSDFGIKPYRGLMGALKVRDSLEILFEGRLPA